MVDIGHLCTLGLLTYGLLCSTLSADKKDLINKVLKTIPEKENLPEDVSTVWEATGCDECNNTGYQGRIGIYEAVVMDEEVEALVKSSASEREIANTAVSQGILNMQQDGMLKVLKGVTSLEELERVVEVL